MFNSYFAFEKLCSNGLFFIFFNKFIYLFIFGFIGSLLLCVGFSCGERGLLFIVACRLLIAVASLAAEHRL